MMGNNAMYRIAVVESDPPEWVKGFFPLGDGLTQVYTVNVEEAARYPDGYAQFVLWYYLGEPRDPSDRKSHIMYHELELVG